MALRLRGGIAGGGGAAGSMPGEGDPILDTREDLGGNPFPGPGAGPGPIGDPGQGGKLIPHLSQGSEGPRERIRGPLGGDGGMQHPFSGGTQATPPSPTAPSPMDATPGGGMTPPMQPFQPMPSIGAAGLASPARRLFGGSSGLTGGGLGVPNDPMNLNSSDSISSLIQSLLKRNGGLSGGGGLP